jgi:hypothetical protein
LVEDAVRAPVYRHLDSRSGLLGLTAVEWGPVLLVFWLGLVENSPNVGLALAGALYSAVRAATRGRPDGFVQHLAQWWLRRRYAAGRISAAARARAPRFPFATYAAHAGERSAR